MFAIIGAIIAGFTYVAFTIPDDGILSGATIMNLKLVSLSMIVGYLAPFMAWATYLHDATFYGSEYDARMEFKRAGDPDEVIERKIEELSTGGAFGQLA